MDKRSNWIKKNLFYVVLFLCAAVLIGGYFVWFLQPVPLIPENAENIRIGNVSYNGSASEPYIIIMPYDHSTDARLVKLNREGTDLLIEKLRTITLRAYSRPVITGEEALFDKTIDLSLLYNIGDLQYHHHLSLYNYLIDIGGPYSPDGSSKLPLRPDSYFDLRLKDEQQVKDLYNYILYLADNYAE